MVERLRRTLDSERVRRNCLVKLVEGTCSSKDEFSNGGARYSWRNCKRRSSSGGKGSRAMGQRRHGLFVYLQLK